MDVEVWWFNGHRRMIPPVPYDYFIPDFSWLDPERWKRIKRKRNKRPIKTVTQFNNIPAPASRQKQKAESAEQRKLF
jgi:hypothetical protein